MTTKRVLTCLRKNRVNKVLWFTHFVADTVFLHLKIIPVNLDVFVVVIWFFLGVFFSNKIYINIINMFEKWQQDNNFKTKIVKRKREQKSIFLLFLTAGVSTKTEDMYSTGASGLGGVQVAHLLLFCVVYVFFPI